MNFRANGKLLISGEYAVLDGSLALAVPSRFGQSMSVESGEISNSPVLDWQAFLPNNEFWFSVKINLKTISVIETDNPKLAQKLIDLFEIIEKLNHGFFKNQNRNINCKTRLEFPKDWGLGSSSTLVSLLAQFSGTDAYELNRLSFGSSGYDIACATSKSALLYQLKKGKPNAEAVEFNPSFKDKLYFVHLNKKQDTQLNVSENYKDLKPEKDWLNGISSISYNMLKTDSIDEFEQLMNLHEEMISSRLGFRKVKELYFSDYKGCVKSLGAWGGDFVMITAKEDFKEYFESRGFETILSFDEMAGNGAQTARCSHSSQNKDFG